MKQAPCPLLSKAAEGQKDDGEIYRTIPSPDGASPPGQLVPADASPALSIAPPLVTVVFPFQNILIAENPCNNVY